MTPAEQAQLDRIEQMLINNERMLKQLLEVIGRPVEPIPASYGSFSQRVAECLARPKRKSPERKKP